MTAGHKLPVLLNCSEWPHPLYPYLLHSFLFPWNLCLKRDFGPRFHWTLQIKKHFMIDQDYLHAREPSKIGLNWYLQKIRVSGIKETLHSEGHSVLYAFSRWMDLFSLSLCISAEECDLILKLLFWLPWIPCVRRNQIHPSEESEFIYYNNTAQKFESLFVFYIYMVVFASKWLLEIRLSKSGRKIVHRFEVVSKIPRHEGGLEMMFWMFRRRVLWRKEQIGCRVISPLLCFTGHRRRVVYVPMRYTKLFTKALIRILSAHSLINKGNLVYPFLQHSELSWSSRSTSLLL